MGNTIEKSYISKRYEIWKEGEYAFRMADRFRPNLVCYLHPESEGAEPRPCMIVVPGGGYELVSPSEGELVALRFYEKGWNCFVFTYTTNFLRNEPLHDRAEQDLSRAIRFVRARAEAFRIDPARLVITGFSAGGHLCGCLAVHPSEIRDPDPVFQGISNRPDAVILSYPVISTDPAIAHQGSVDALLGPAPTEDASPAEAGGDSSAAVKAPAASRYARELDFYSLEKHVTKEMPPVFVWLTATDDLVPADNSLRFASALRAQGVPFALHLFSSGKHGLSLATQEWADGRFGEPYCLEQLYELLDGWQGGRITDSARDEKELRAWNYVREHTAGAFPAGEPNGEVQCWPELAQSFLETVM
ncbi:alpha/beta hydrolase [Lachnoclostridium sp. Marseille-P6806]|uniref:alpha/beta hydrolase n=1 Tax=Lachnoclostridium sp. Marseille-P6806 TaxID=2364793 RepID=UPI00103189A9|nr:alpha/beta hydrolase [Lachnoclostridium sp. Marseille-P6806]